MSSGYVKPVKPVYSKPTKKPAYAKPSAMPSKPGYPKPVIKPRIYNA